MGNARNLAKLSVDSNGDVAAASLDNVPAGFETGTRLMFAQNAAPTGWTKDTTNYNDHAIRVVTGTAGTTGGAVDFTTAFASQTPTGSVSVSGTVGSYTLTTAEIPSHNHGYTTTDSFGNSPNTQSATGSTGYSTRTATTNNTGSGGSHSHSFSGSGSFSGSAINLAVKYLNVITATKD